jgi:hypothetical protein
MNLVQRYIQAVKIELPSSQREDIGRELQSTIQEELEALAERNGRTPSEAEVGEYLRRLGHPVQVASRYWPRRSLVSEAAYPLYKQALMVVLSVYVTVGVLMAFLDFEQTRSWSLMLFPRVLYDLAAAVLFGFFAVTVVFHYFGDQMAAEPFFWRWNPRRLPDLSGLEAYLPRSQTMWDLLGNVFALSVLTVGSLSLNTSHFVLDFGAAGGVLAALRVLVLVDFGLNLLNLVQPYWTRSKLVAHTLVSLAFVFCLVQLLLLPQLVTSASAPNPAFLDSMNLSLKVTVGIVMIVVIWAVWQNQRRLLPLKLPWF